MLNRIITFSLQHRAFVVIVVFLAAIGGGVALSQLDVDAFPDTTPVQVQINTSAPALGPLEIEQRITFPIEQALSNLPKLVSLRSVSKFGLSSISATFEDSVDVYFARQMVNERLSGLQMPPEIERPKLGPIATGLGEVFHYVVTGVGVEATQLRTLHDWIVKPRMRTVPGTAETLSWGGFEKQFQIRIDPDRLIKHGLTFDQVVAAVEANNRNVGGGMIRQGSAAAVVQGVGRTTNIEEIKNIVVTSQHGVPLHVRDVADVEIGSEIRRGAATYDGRGETVLGISFLLMGENTRNVTRAMRERLEEIRPTLPPNIDVRVVYDRTDLVDQVIATVKQNLFEGGLLVIAVLFAFLGNVRAAIIVAVAIPLSLLFAFAGMLQFGIAASLLSLGAIDFGMIVDSSVVMVENCVRHLAHGDAEHRPKVDVVRDAAIEVRRPTMFGELIIMIVYLPILALEGIEGKMFRPMALTVIFALAGSMILSLTLMPVLASIFIPKKIEEREPWLMRLAHRLHAPVLRFSMTHKVTVLGFAALVLFVAFVLIAPNLGSEFVPRLSEGTIAMSIVRQTSTPLEETVAANARIEQLVKQNFPAEVAHLWSRTGTAEVSTDPMGLDVTDMFCALTPRKQWTKARSQADLTDQMAALLREIPGQNISFVQPIEMRMNELTAGIRTDVAVLFYGDDLDVLALKSREIETILRGVPGAADVAAEQITGQPVLEVKVRQAELARHGVPARAVLDLVESLGSKPLGDVIEGQLRFPLVVRLPERYRRGADEVGAILIPTAAGERLPLAQLADVRLIEGPATITRDFGQRRIAISCNVRGRDVGSFVAEAERALKEKLVLPPGRYSYTFGGQFEHLLRAEKRLSIVVPIAAILIFVLLYLTYHSLVDALRVFTGVPFGWVGGIFALWLRDMPFSVSAAIGFIAMSGVAVLDDMILVSYVRQLRKKGLPLDEAVSQAAVTRLRPVLMTSLVAGLGFLPMAFSTGVGAEVQRPLATVVIGGVIGSFIMSLLVLRVLYVVFSSSVEGDAVSPSEPSSLIPEEAAAVAVSN